MESANDWSTRAKGWLDRDLALMNEPTGWRSLVARPDLQIDRRSMPDDKNDLFRWRLPRVAAPVDVVFEGFVHRVLDYHHEWTREFKGGRVVETLAGGARILYQRFEPGVPGIRPRDLCSIEVVRDLGPNGKVASFRSVDRLPNEPGHERIDWWGAALCRPNAPDAPGGHAASGASPASGARAARGANGASQTTELVYLDRENQGGRFPAWLMNLAMPRYLVYQAEQVMRFFANGGPPELRSRA